MCLKGLVEGQMVRNTLAVVLVLFIALAIILPTSIPTGFAAINLEQGKSQTSVYVTYSSPNLSTGADITFTATATGDFKKITIVIDGNSRLKGNQCATSPCVVTQKLTVPGVHTYYALASGSGSTVRDPIRGSKSLTLSDATPPVVKVGAYLDSTYAVEEKQFKLGDSVYLKAKATDNSGKIKSVAIYVAPPGTPYSKTSVCLSSPCDGTFAPTGKGNYLYFATAVDNTGNSATTVARGFSVV